MSGKLIYECRGNFATISGLVGPYCSGHEGGRIYPGLVGPLYPENEKLKIRTHKYPYITTFN